MGLGVVHLRPRCAPHHRRHPASPAGAGAHHPGTGEGGVSCPCGSGDSYEACCAPRHDGAVPAETAEALMRSRYCAFVRGLGDYLAATHDAPSHAKESAETSRWAKSVGWLGLTVQGQEAGGVGDEQGTVEFSARYLEDGAVVTLQEKSRFVKRDGKWLYASGTPTVTRTKVERNAPCPCGSGRKFKQCHA
ncbi:MAG: SEC-C domain-containing protein [Myxococcales bacterium]|nr:SEC-C domain-containing protein [Myxococcales bacterium]